jgi:maltose phosphorylase
MCYSLLKNRKELKIKASVVDRDKYIANTFSEEIKPGDELMLIKFVSVLSSLNNPKNELINDVNKRLKEASSEGYEKLFLDHKKEWEKIWKSSDVIIDGDVAAQQAIRFNIFHLNQTYTGKDERLNIGPKGFTGEKYGGSTYWDTEAFS